MRRKKIFALFLALALLASCLAGCGEEPIRIAPARPPKGEPAGTGYFTQTWHGDVAFADMAYEHYDYARFLDKTAPIYEMAKSGGTAQAFSDADYAVYDELNYIFTLYSLIDLQHYADPSDDYAAEEVIYAQELYYDAYDEYCRAMRTMAESPYADRMKKAYHESYIQWFLRYEPDESGGDKESYTAENRLVQTYYKLIAAEEPDYDAIGELYVELVNLRNEDVRRSGYDNYAEYAYENIYVKDYTPQDAQSVWAGAKQYFVPLVERYGWKILDEAGDLYYSDKIDCSPEKVLAALDTVVTSLSPELKTAYDYMITYGLYDIDPSPKKANTGFTVLLYDSNEPFIFNAAMDTYYDYTDMFHEFGHFANYFYTQSDLVFGASDNDLSELQSQGLEVLSTFFFDDIFGSKYGDIIRDDLLLNMIFSVVDGALYDEFQNRVYSEPELTAEKVNRIFAELYEEYGYVPYDGYEHEWMGISHNFENPFYYISYAVSALGALEIYGLASEDWDAGLDRYLTAAAMDSEVYYYSEALEEAGFNDVFDPATYRSIAKVLEKSLAA